MGKLVLFDINNKIFVNENGDKVDISGKVIFPRCTINEVYLLLTNIEKEQGKSIMAIEEYTIIEYWFEEIKTNRRLQLTTRSEIEANIEQYEREFGNQLFIKTVQKHFSGVCIIMDIELNGQYKSIFDCYFSSLSLSIIDAEMPLVVYKKVNILEDDYGNREWRAFVVDNKLWSLSRCSDDIIQIEPYILKKAKNKIISFKNLMPSSCVVDFFEYEDEAGSIIFDVCEFNPIVASGAYRNNNLVF